MSERPRFARLVILFWTLRGLPLAVLEFGVDIHCDVLFEIFARESPVPARRS